MQSELKIDILGRITLDYELRKQLHWSTCQKIALYCEDNQILMRKASIIDKLVNFRNNNYYITKDENKRVGIYEYKKATVALRTVDEFRKNKYTNRNAN